MTDDITESNEPGVDLFTRPILTPSHQDSGAKRHGGTEASALLPSDMWRAWQQTGALLCAWLTLTTSLLRGTVTQKMIKCFKNFKYFESITSSARSLRLRALSSV